MACFQIWQKEYKGSRVLWGFLNNLPDTVGIVQLMTDGMREGWGVRFRLGWLFFPHCRGEKKFDKSV